MTFEFKSGGTWDPETHTYKGAEDGTTDPGWTAESVDGTNNKITLTNHSNDDVQADFTTNVESTLFGTDNKVVGNFFADNAKALAAAKVLEPAAPATDLEIVDILAGGVKLDTADPGDGTDGTATTTDVYYALSGKPTADATLKSAVQKIGTITVTLSPYTAPEA